MRIEDIEAKIAEQQGIIIEAKAKLDAWYEVRQSFSAKESRPRKPPKSAVKHPGITEHIYAVLPTMKGKFTSSDIVQKVKERFGDSVNERNLSTAVCSFLHSTTTGAYKEPRYPLKTCGKRDGRKLYTKK